MKEEGMVLITYHFKKAGRTLGEGNFCYAIRETPADFIRSVQRSDDGEYIIINVLPLSTKEVEEFNGKIKGM